MPPAARVDKEVAGASRARQQRGRVAVTEIVVGAQRVGDLDGEDGITPDHFASPPPASREQRQLGKGTTGSSLNLKIAA
ncbi:hypothetical protein llap_10223 [Limosa lapponica baueri]|uniref:Uncharacterized protein n=1 Tax=Limosa lapponica baueri TaxID=1758121 RepID=A0A2I0U0B2_LIMLA|nr:hypothetical protein llap_10223 [Limosa lapponica baueri]